MTKRQKKDETLTQIIKNLSEVSPNYQAIFCDIWGVIHNGVEVFQPAIAALMEARLNGAYVGLVSNSPRTETGIHAQLDHIGVPRHAYDDVTTAGEALQGSFFNQPYKTYKFIGRECDRALTTELPENVVNNMQEVAQISEADVILCAELEPNRPDPAQYEIELRQAAEHDLPFYCANPDIVVDHGQTRIWCAGALARDYENYGGGTVYQFGKPHPPIYQYAKSKLSQKINREVESVQILFIGDGIATDLKGAMMEDMDALFVSGGLAFEETETNRLLKAPNPNAKLLEEYLHKHQLFPRYTIGTLR